MIQVDSDLFGSKVGDAETENPSRTKSGQPAAFKSISFVDQASDHVVDEGGQIRASHVIEIEAYSDDNDEDAESDLKVKRVHSMSI